MSETPADDAQASSESKKLLNFPPFFTKQLNEEVLMRQKVAWQDIILEHFRKKNRFILRLTSASANEISAEDDLESIFTNSAIKRKANFSFIHELIEFVVGNGNAAWIASSNGAAGNTRSACLVYWKKPDLLAKEIAAWIDSTAASGNIYTVYELLSSEEFERAPFHALEIEMFFQALLVLQRQKRVEILAGTTPMEYGIKFI